MKGFSIGTKIFAISVALILLLTVVSGVSAYMVERVRHELQLQALVFLPLSNRIAAIETTVLEGEVQIERLRLALAEHRSGVTLTDVEDKIEGIHLLVDEQFTRAYALLQTLEIDELSLDSAITATRVEGALQGVEAEYRDYRNNLAKLMEAHRKGQGLQALLLDELLMEEEEEIYHQLERMRLNMQDHVEESVGEILRLDNLMDRLIWILTGLAVLFGLSFSALITSRIVRPMRDLVTGLKRVEEGDLDTELMVLSKDETAAMAESFNEMIAGLRAKERITETFGKYVDARVVDSLIGNPSLTKPGGDMRRMSVIFTDMTGFTSLSQQLPPSSLVTLLNAYFERMAAPVQNRDGVIDKFIGDAIMAYWGAPFVDPRHQADYAVHAALDQLSLLQGFRDDVPEILGIPTDANAIDLHIGVATGQALVGTVGSAHHRNYTIMGDTVNVAARLEGACKVYGVRVLVDEATFKETDGVLFREIDALRVKGRSVPIRIYEPLALEPASTALTQMAHSFDQGLSAYRNRDFEQAERCFAACLEAVPEDRVALTFLERTMALAANPPAPEWDGVWTISSK